MVRSFDREARPGRMLPLAVTYRGDLVGQLTVSGIAWGSLRSAHAGYWVDAGSPAAVSSRPRWP